MNILHTYIAEQSKTCRESWFKDHKATTLPGNAPVVIGINWQKPETWNYGCRYFLHRRWLICVGDIGEAIFEWSQDITLEFLASLNFDYFMGKCQASPSGRDFEQWNSRVAFKRFSEFINEDGMESLKNELGAEITVGTGEEEFREIAREYYDKTGNAEMASMIGSFGKVPSVYAIGMFVGLQMAITQLKEVKP